MLKNFLLILFFCVGCQSECPVNRCLMACENDLFELDSNGCPLCRCATTATAVLPPSLRLSCPKFRCNLSCKYGFKKTRSGCDLCQCSLGPKCAKVSCENECVNGFLSDRHGCKTCLCARVGMPVECASMTCPEGSDCREVATGCERNLDPNCKPIAIVSCVKVCPMLKCKPCKTGYVVDPDGCKTCKCIDPCEGVVCPYDQICTPERSEKGYSCAPKICKCPQLQMPAFCNHLTTKDICNGCYSNCDSSPCDEDEKCCSDWYGCMSCVKCTH